ncbi:MAG: hypothetical protein JWM96_1058 [Alphaproteobacteria bacterium]|nr:hypothetical protein [Alphaproteobacteria bacterium]
MHSENRQPKNLQFAHFITKGWGENYDFHRLGTLTHAAAQVSYYLARNKDLATEEFVLEDNRALYCADIKYKQNDCGVVVVRDDTDIYNFKPGLTPYGLQICFLTDKNKEDFASNDEKGYHLPPTALLYGENLHFLTIKQDMGIVKNDPGLVSFQHSLSGKIRSTYDRHFQVAALL